ncbi:hypothetical protein DFH08DRAFT_828140 [Mycena albidolilacea]|uniref:Uncharacterized protein n=1 Tax=Mycena albidolilacea TaxID=1033008 RepID=A0AAD6YWT8_9AGAR|nr:hypothetical protein DFH08DRAFT_828140 [Mycena albidolilacea]
MLSFCPTIWPEYIYLSFSARLINKRPRPPQMDHANTFLSLPNVGWTALQNPLSRVHAARAIPAHKQQAADPTDSSAMNSLAQTVQIIWNQLPSDWRKAALCVIADGHKKQAEDLIAHGSGSSNNAAVQLEYYKYLVLHPHKEASEYKKICARVYQLEEANGGRVGVGPAFWLFIKR